MLALCTLMLTLLIRTREEKESNRGGEPSCLSALYQLSNNYQPPRRRIEVVHKYHESHFRFLSQIPNHSIDGMISLPLVTD